MKKNTRAEFQKQVSRLKKSGIIPKSTDVRKVKQTRHYNNLIKQYSDVAEGNARLFPVKTIENFSALLNDNVQLIERTTRRGNTQFFVEVKQAEKRGVTVGNIRFKKDGVVYDRTYKTKTGNKLKRRVKLLNDYTWEGLEQKLRNQNKNERPFRIKIFTGETGVYNNIDEAIQAMRGYRAARMLSRHDLDIKVKEEIFNSIELEEI